MNPDGFELAIRTKPENRGWLTGRSNAHGVDLNRNFPALDNIFYFMEANRLPYFDHLFELFHSQEQGQQEQYEPEVSAVAKWILSWPFVLSANLHEGDLVANYPFDEGRSPKVQAYAKSPDDATFRYLAENYARKHAHMSKNDHAPCDGTAANNFARQGGITNGAKWYSVSGGMQDFSYLATNAFELTLELGCTKLPAPDTLPMLWHDNKEALLEFIRMTHIGVKGLVLDATSGKPIQNAIVWVRNVTDGKSAETAIKHPVTTWVTGDYFRPLVPGIYQLAVEAEGYGAQAKLVNVSRKSVAEHRPIVVTFHLVPASDADDEEGGENEENNKFETALSEFEQQPIVDGSNNFQLADPEVVRESLAAAAQQRLYEQQMQRAGGAYEDREGGGQQQQFVDLTPEMTEELLQLVKAQQRQRAVNPAVYY